MKDYLVFRLYGPMASWGLPAVGGDRPTGLFPGRAALSGLLGAALGIRRDESARLDALNTSISLAVKQVTPTSLLRDYQTAQVPSQKKGLSHLSRKSELSEPKLNTILSSRDYRCDGLWTIAISVTDSATLTLNELCQALLEPVFTLSLGRKSCPLAAPLSPRVVTNATLREALDTDFPCFTRSDKEDELWLGKKSQVTYYWEGDRADISSEAALVTHPWDVPLDRQRWQFKQRTLFQATLMEKADVPV